MTDPEGMVLLQEPKESVGCAEANYLCAVLILGVHIAASQTGALRASELVEGLKYLAYYASEIRVTWAKVRDRSFYFQVLTNLYHSDDS